MRIKTVLTAFLGFLLVFLFLPSHLSAQGHFEFGFHYGTWGVDLLKSLIEKGISNGLEKGLKDPCVKLSALVKEITLKFSLPRNVVYAEALKIKKDNRKCIEGKKYHGKA